MVPDHLGIFKLHLLFLYVYIMCTHVEVRRQLVEVESLFFFYHAGLGD